MLQPVNVATPATAVFGFAAQTKVAPPGVVMVSVTALVFVVTVLPTASSTVTTGWVANAAPPAAPTGCVVKMTFAAAPTATGNEELTAVVSTPSVAVNVYVPTRSIRQPPNVATPATAPCGFVVHVKVAPLGVVSAKVTGLVFPLTVLPPASCTTTIG
jgi:hypothetical protein